VIARVRAMDPHRADAFLALVVGLEFQVEAALADVAGGDRAALHLLMGVAAVGLALRRRIPLLGLSLVMIAFVGVFLLPQVVGEQLYLPFFSVMFAAYSAGANTSGRSLAAAAVIVAGSITLSSAIDPYVERASDWLFGAVILGGGPLLVGRLINSRARLNRALRDKTARLERERATQGEQATLEERTRIAGELHDVVAHALSAMVVQGAGARRLIASDRQAAEAAFAAVEATGREALDDLRRLLGVLRREDAELALAPSPSLAHLGDLARRFRAAGLPVDVRVVGAPGTLEPGVDVAAYRVVQEALAEARERGHAGRAEVLLRFAEQALEIEVGDDGAPADATRPRRLLGVRERVSLLGGEVTAAAPRAGGYLVRARLPLRSAA
jgi:signal transduction histidine kinase